MDHNINGLVEVDSQHARTLAERYLTKNAEWRKREAEKYLEEHLQWMERKNKKRGWFRKPSPVPTLEEFRTEMENWLKNHKPYFEDEPYYSYNRILTLYGQKWVDICNEVISASQVNKSLFLTLEVMHFLRGQS